MKLRASERRDGERKKDTTAMTINMFRNCRNMSEALGKLPEDVKARDVASSQLLQRPRKLSVDQPS